MAKPKADEPRKARNADRRLLAAVDRMIAAADEAPRPAPNKVGHESRFAPQESAKLLARRVGDLALAIRVALGAPTWFYHWMAVQAALAVETGRLERVQLDQLLSSCATNARSPYAMFSKEAPRLFERCGLPWFDGAAFKASARHEVQWDEA